MSSNKIRKSITYPEAIEILNNTHTLIDDICDPATQEAIKSPEDYECHGTLKLKENQMLYNGIIRHTDGQYEVFVKIQDGTENMGKFSSEDAAVEAYFRGHKIMNGWNEKDCLKRPPEIYEVKPIQNYELIRIK